MRIRRREMILTKKRFFPLKSPAPEIAFSEKSCIVQNSDHIRRQCCLIKLDINGKSMKKVSFLIVGGGGRGTVYARHILEMNEQAEVTAIADPRDFFRNRIGDMYRIPENRRFHDWRDALRGEKVADAVIIATQDRLHVEPAVAFADAGYHILIEKPLAPDEEGCRRIVEAADRNGILFSVCHVLRYSNFTRTLKKLIDRGAVGRVMSIQHLDPVGHWRYAHSYVRGNWRREDESSSILLAKSIHDLDWLCYIAGSDCIRVSSFGSRMFFRKENQPREAADRCLECPIEPTCSYSAPRFYLRRIRENIRGAYVESVTPILTEESMLEALRTGPYGRCVFACDNNVADHQVVNLEFRNGVTAVFTLAGCARFGPRRTTVFGSEGELFGDETTLSYYSYLTGETRGIPIPPHIATDAHGGGDYNLLESFVKAVVTGDPTHIVTGAHVSLQSHRLVFDAEISRKEHRIVELDPADSGPVQ